MLTPLQTELREELGEPEPAQEQEPRVLPRSATGLDMSSKPKSPVANTKSQPGGDAQIDCTVYQHDEHVNVISKSNVSATQGPASSVVGPALSKLDTESGRRVQRVPPRHEAGVFSSSGKCKPNFVLERLERSRASIITEIIQQISSFDDKLQTLVGKSDQHQVAYCQATINQLHAILRFQNASHDYERTQHLAAAQSLGTDADVLVSAARERAEELDKERAKAAMEQQEAATAWQATIDATLLGADIAPVDTHPVAALVPQSSVHQGDRVDQANNTLQSTREKHRATIQQNAIEQLTDELREKDRMLAALKYKLAQTEQLCEKLHGDLQLERRRGSVNSQPNVPCKSLKGQSGEVSACRDTRSDGNPPSEVR